MRTITRFSVLLALAVCEVVTAADEVRAETGIMVPMRDGVRLSTDLYFPEEAAGKLPAVLWRSIYDKTGAYGREPALRELVQQGYVAVIQDTRGRGSSEGEFTPSVGDRNDGYDTVDWLTGQPWSNGKVGSAGCSSLGESQLLLAAARHPHHVAAIPQASASGFFIRGRPWASFDGGVFELAQTAGWFSVDGHGVDFSVLPIIDVLKKAGRPPSHYEKFAASNPVGPYFQALEWIRPGETLDVPALFFDSWYDYGAAETLDLFNMLRSGSAGALARNNQFVIIAPGTHCGYRDATERTIVGERDLGDARFDVLDLQIRWFDHWLKGIDNAVVDRPRIRYYLMGANEWRNADTWPVAGTRFTRLYLGSGGRANSLRGDGTLDFEPPSQRAADTFIYDPASPVPSLGGHACCTGTDTESGSYDQTRIEMRDDVLVYTSAPLDQGIEVTGPLKLTLQVSSSAVDTDFTAKLVDVYPDDRAFNIQEGVLRMRYRDGFDKSLRMQSGEVYEAHIDLHATSNFFGPGHRIRLEVSSSNFPRWDRNLNTGGNNYDETEFEIARNSVHHSTERPSYLILPIVD
ncbi:MAG: CocE/NonD family hydrolase [Woeseiaceae bacterium]